MRLPFFSPVFQSVPFFCLHLVFRVTSSSCLVCLVFLSFCFSALAIQVEYAQFDALLARFPCMTTRIAPCTPNMHIALACPPIHAYPHGGCLFFFFLSVSFSCVYIGFALDTAFFFATSCLRYFFHVYLAVKSPAV